MYNLVKYTISAKKFTQSNILIAQNNINIFYCEYTLTLSKKHCEYFF